MSGIIQLMKNRRRYRMKDIQLRFLMVKGSLGSDTTIIIVRSSYHARISTNRAKFTGLIHIADIKS